jgi:hypothetical protein
LIERIRGIEQDAAAATEVKATDAAAPADEGCVTAILAYLNQRGYQMASFDLLHRRVDETLADEQFQTIIKNNPTVFRVTRLTDGRTGLAKLIP